MAPVHPCQLCLRHCRKRWRRAPGGWRGARAPGQSSAACRVAMPACSPLFPRSKRPGRYCLGRRRSCTAQGVASRHHAATSACLRPGPALLPARNLRSFGARLAEPRKESLSAHGCVTERAAAQRRTTRGHPGMAAAILYTLWGLARRFADFQPGGAKTHLGGVSAPAAQRRTQGRESCGRLVAAAAALRRLGTLG